MTVIRSPARSRPGSSVKRSYERGGELHSGALPAHVRKSLFALPAHMPIPPPPRITLRKRRIIPDGGYSHAMEKTSSFSTISDPDVHGSSTEEDGSLENEDTIRCVCGMDKDGGTTMIQWYAHPFPWLASC